MLIIHELPTPNKQLPGTARLVCGIMKQLCAALWQIASKCWAHYPVVFPVMAQSSGAGSDNRIIGSHTREPDTGGHKDKLS